MSTLFRPERRSSQAPTDSLAEMFRRRLLPGLGAPVTTDSAMTHSAVYECVDLIADGVSTMPVHRFRQAGDTRVPQSGPWPALDNPSEDDDPVNWRRIVVVCWLLRGYAAGLVTAIDRVGRAQQIELVHPDRVSCFRTRPDGPPEFHLDGKAIDRYPVGKLWVAPGKKLFPGDPLGRSVLEFAMADTGIGLAARKFGADFFNGGGHPTALISADQEVEKDLAERVKERFLEAVGGSREPVVMGGGWTYEQIQIAPNESQFLETIKANRTMIAGFFKVPPSQIGAPSGDGMTYKNVEQDDLRLLKQCFWPWVTRMETTLNPLTARPDFVKLNFDAHLRTDLGTRYRAHDVGVRAGFLSVNDVRRLEDLAPISGGDLYLWPPYRNQLSEPELVGGADLED